MDDSFLHTIKKETDSSTIRYEFHITLPYYDTIQTARLIPTFEGIYRLTFRVDGGNIFLRSVGKSYPCTGL